MDWLAAFFEILGTILLGRRKKIGWICYVLSGLCWITVSFTSKVYGLLPVSFTGLGIYIVNFTKWNKSERRNKIKEKICQNVLF